MDRVRNEEMQRRTEVVIELADQTEKGSVERMEEECLVKNITRTNVKDTRPWAKP